MGGAGGKGTGGDQLPAGPGRAGGGSGPGVERGIGAEKEDGMFRVFCQAQRGREQGAGVGG